MFRLFQILVASFSDYYQANLDTNYLSALAPEALSASDNTV